MKSQIDTPVTFFIPAQIQPNQVSAESQAQPLNLPENVTIQESKSPVLETRPPAFPDWTRMPSHYATFQEFQKDRPLSVWRVEEAMYQLLGRGYQQNLRMPMN